MFELDKCSQCLSKNSSWCCRTRCLLISKADLKRFLFCIIHVYERCLNLPWIKLEKSATSEETSNVKYDITSLSLVHPAKYKHFNTHQYSNVKWEKSYASIKCIVSSPSPLSPLCLILLFSLFKYSQCAFPPCELGNSALHVFIWKKLSLSDCNVLAVLLTADSLLVKLSCTQTSSLPLCGRR